MSRSGYSDDIDGRDWILWRGAVASALRGKRGQSFLHELLATLDALPEKRLAAGVFVTRHHGCCAMGAVAQARGIDTSSLDLIEVYDAAAALGIAQAMAAEIADKNDDGGRYDETPEQRWVRMRAWVASQVAAQVATSAQAPAQAQATAKGTAHDARARRLR